MSNEQTAPAAAAAVDPMQAMAALLAQLKMMSPADQAKIGAALIPSAPLPFAGDALEYCPHLGAESGKIQTVRLRWIVGKAKNGEPRYSTQYCNLNTLVAILTHAKELRAMLSEKLPTFHPSCFEDYSLSSYLHAIAD